MMIVVGVSAGVVGLLAGFYAGYRYTTYKMLSMVMSVFGPPKP